MARKQWARQLGGLVEDREDEIPRAIAPGPGRAAITSAEVVFQSSNVEYLEYGDPKGQPIPLLQSSHPPNLFEGLRGRLFEAGLRVIAPLKPGSGRSAHLTGCPGPEQMVPFYAAVMENAGVAEAIIAGQASGGLYALEFARQLPTKTKALCLIDTGVPFRTRSELMDLPKTIRRTMVPARYFPDLLYLPHKLVAAYFRRSGKGEARVVDCFFQGSPFELNLTRTRRDAYDFTRALISYSFDDTDRLVQDVSRWVSDWSALLEDVANRKRIHFFHGEDNLLFRRDRVETWVDARDNCKLFTAPTGGQLALLEHPDLFVACLHALTNKAD